MDECACRASVEKWDVQEITCPGPSGGNPFVEQEIYGEFVSRSERKRVRGFYDGDGVYKVRFMPRFEAEYRFTLSGSFLNSEPSGRFCVTPPSAGNHGPVRVEKAHHFAYEDGTPHYSFGTTCYAWAFQSDGRIQQTLKTLQGGPFNKLRFCVFPKHYDYNLSEPRSYPYEGEPMDSSVLTPENFHQYTGKREGNHFDYSRFNPAHFRHLERCILRLREQNIEADLILLHPYDRWGFSLMSPDQDGLYFRYVVSRFAAYRNVWWSLANEYDLMPQKKLADWERLAQTLCEEDPYGHLRSIHNCIEFYDHTRPWVTHASIQRQDLYRTTEYVDEWRARFDKPIVCDEIAYEGNIQFGWGNISAQELVRRFWEATLRGGYAGHGETYLSPDNVLWWSHGGTLHGESPSRIAFLRKIVEELPGVYLKKWPGMFDETCAVWDTPQARPGVVQPYYLFYYGFTRPSFRDFRFDGGTRFKAEVIDTWNMTIQDAGIHSGRFRIPLPGREYMAVRLQKI